MSTTSPSTTSESVTIRVGTSYDVVIGRNLADRLPDLLGEGVQRVALLYAGEIGNLAEPLVDVLLERYEVLALGLPDGENAKTAAVANDCWEALGEKGFTRSDAVVTFGGGATTDLGGFVAASWLRGVKVVHVPTTLLAMVDAAVGGKTGINTSAGKNLVGAFWEPAGVLCDLDLLRSLPQAELTAGMGEVVKCGFIADPEILTIVENAAAPLTAEAPQLLELVRRAIQVKADVVSGDLREQGGRDGYPGREVLNYGHTLGHAIEKHSGYQLRHGEAVAIGCIYAAEIAARSGLIDADLLARHRTAFDRAGLPTTYPWGDYAAGFDDLIGAMRVDKKARGSVLRFLVLRGLADPTILAGPDEQLLRDAFAALAPHSSAQE